MDTSLSQLNSLSSVDIYRGVKDLQKIEDNIIEKDNVAYVNSGISAVFGILKEHLINSGLVENILCEYSLISSTLDPFNKGKLDCCAMVYGTSEFKDLVEKFYLKSIEITDNEIGISIYQHPNFLYDIDKVGAKSTITYKPATLGEYNKLEIVDEQSCDTKYTKVDIDTSSSNSLWIQAFHLPRPYDEMIKEAKDFYQRKKNKPNTWLTLEEVQERLHAYCHYNISCKKSKDSYYISFPIFGSIASNQLSEYLVVDPTSSAENIPLQGIGACFIYFEVSSQIAESQLKTIVNKISYEMGNLIRFISANYLFNVGLNLRETVLKESLKSAKAAIMSRNMSHNLGSHVMFYVKQKLQSVSKIVDNKVLDNIIPNVIPGKITDIQDLEEKLKEAENAELPFLVGLGRFINYLQERQDYIATIATDYIPARSTISFKDFIYDELKPDLRYRRHHADNPKGEAGWQSGNLLLDYIAYSEDYCSSDDIVIRFGDFDGEHSKDDKGKEIADFQNLRKFNVAIPGGVIGRQAIFSIFENIIRNAAKHSERRDDNKLVLQLSLLKDKEELNKLGTGAFRARREGDNEKYATELVELYKNYWDSYHYLRIKIDMPNQQNSIEKLIESLADPYLENGVMKDSAKGLKEMRISAAWLRGYDIDTKIPLSEPHVLSIYSEPYNGDNEKMTISYILCIPKPKKVALIVNDNSSYKNLNDSIEPFGCKIFGYQNDVFDKNNNFNNTIPNYEIVCMLDDADINKKVYPQISSRHITSSEITLDIVERLNNICKDTTDKDQKHALLKLEIDLIYEIWYEHWCQSAYRGRKDYKLTILDDKTIDNSKTDSLKENYAIADSQTVILDSTGNIKLDYCTNAVVYKTHFKGLQTESNDSYLTSAVCIESITGNNSTARFIRQDKWNKMWKSKLLSSGIAKVAIFDERIYSTFVPSKGIRPITEIYDLIKEKSEKEIVEVLTKEGFTEDEAYAVAYEDPGFNGIIENKCKKYNVEVAQKNHERGVWAFDIEPENDIVKIKGYNVCIEDKVNAFETRYPSETVVATIKKCGEQYDIVDVNDKIFPKGTKIFDFVSIHLGILDKIYNAFKIKGNEIEMRKVTNAIHKYLAKAETPLDYNEFLPNFIIHSGRAKPSKLDMPQEQPFVQFAAIDYAVKDCKCTLVELLISAYHENSNSNN